MARTLHEWHELQSESTAIWERIAPFWDEYMGEGNDFHRELIAPATARLLDVQPEEWVLEIACGNGAFARQLARLGANVVASDLSAPFIERAKERTTEHADRIEYRVVDATQRVQLLALGRERFDAAVCNMGLMDMAAVGPLLHALSLLLKPGGRFVFSVMHPCFNSMGTTKVVELADRDGELVRQHTMKVYHYITPQVSKGLGIRGQPEPHYYFHRPLSVLLGACFEAGFAMDGLEEPLFSSDAEPGSELAWEHFRETPPVMVVRMCLPS